MTHSNIHTLHTNVFSKNTKKPKNTKTVQKSRLSINLAILVLFLPRTILSQQQCRKFKETIPNEPVEITRIKQLCSQNDLRYNSYLTPLRNPLINPDLVDPNTGIKGEKLVFYQAKSQTKKIQEYWRILDFIQSGDDCYAPLRYFVCLALFPECIEQTKKRKNHQLEQ